MKTFSGIFANGQKYMGVEVPETSCRFDFDSRSIFYEMPNDVATHSIDSPIELNVGHDKILGTYQTKGEIDFECKLDWVEEVSNPIRKAIVWPAFKDYLNPDNVFTLRRQSLLSLLDRDSRMAFPLEENPRGNKPAQHSSLSPEDDGMNKRLESLWREAESQVRPKSFLIILVK